MKRKLLIGGLFLSLVTGPVLAQETVGFYFRADLGASLSTDASIRDNDQTGFANLCDGAGTCGFELDDIDNSFVVSGGVGYQFSQSLRGDVTVGYRPGFELDDSIASAFGGRDTHSADIDNTTVMVSGYYDFSTALGNFTPYLGGGIGWAYNDIDSTTVTNPASGLSRTHGGSGESDFAWQFVVGAASPIGGNMMLDLSYKYVDAGELDSGTTTVSGAAGGAPFGPFAFNGVSGDVSFHEITLGVRF